MSRSLAGERNKIGRFTDIESSIVKLLMLPRHEGNVPETCSGFVQPAFKRIVGAMDERHENEQYFFDTQTVVHLAAFVRVYPNPCCVCAPTVGQELERAGVPNRTLDLDGRFEGLSGFVRYDVTRPHWLGEEFGIILFDPPFFNAAPVSTFVDAIRMLAKHSFDQKLLISWPIRRSSTILRAFSRFGIASTGYRPGYVSVANEGKNAIEIYGNLAGGEYERLACR